MACSRLTIVNYPGARIEPHYTSVQSGEIGINLEKYAPKALATAQRMIDRYGTDAVAQCCQRRAELLEHGEKDAAALWAEVVDILTELKNSDGAPN